MARIVTSDFVRCQTGRAAKAAALIGGPEWERALIGFVPEGEAEMMPLFASIAHGCAADREDETFDEVYHPRTARGSQNFAMTKLGLYGQSLAALACFFDAPFAKPSPRLSAARRALALNGARLSPARARAA